MLDNVLSVVFKILNFAVFVGIMWYVFKHYLLDSIKKGMTEEQNARLVLEHQNALLAKRYSELEQSIKEQTSLGDTLTHKVALWNEAYRKKELSLKERELQFGAYLEKKQAFQKENIERSHLIAVLLPDLLKDVTRDLHTKMLDEGEGEVFIKKILKTIEKTTL